MEVFWLTGYIYTDKWKGFITSVLHILYSVCGGKVHLHTHRVLSHEQQILSDRHKDYSESEVLGCERTALNASRRYGHKPMNNSMSL